MAKPVSFMLLPIFTLFALVSSVFAAEGENSHTISEVKDFSQVGRVMGEKRLPLVLMFSSDFCHFCRQVESDFLIPMQISGDYTQRAMIRKVKINYGNRLLDFDGKPIDASEFAARYKVTVTPTVVFLDDSGNQLAPRRVGLMTPDFFGGYLDESIDMALDMLRRNTPLRVKLSAAND
jgi:thioredoxin-related protein